MESEKHTTTEQPPDQLTAEQVAKFLAEGREMVNQLQELLERLEALQVGEKKPRPLGGGRHLEAIDKMPYLRISDAARLMGKSRTTIREAIYSGALPFVVDGKRYRIKREALDEWMERTGSR